MTIKAFARHLCHIHGAKLIMRDTSHCDSFGEVDLETRTIVLYKAARSAWLRTLFHELGHLYAQEIGVYPVYHNGETTTPGYARRYAYKAECRVDELGAYLMSCYLPDENYDYWYKRNKKAALAVLGKQYGFK